MKETVAVEVLRKKQLYERFRKQFYSIFNEQLSRFWDVKTPEGLICGFDLVKFDKELIQSEEKESVKDVILRQYGVTALRVIETLIRG